MYCLLHANDQFQQKYIRNYIHTYHFLCSAVHCIPFWNNKYASRTYIAYVFNFNFFVFVLVIHLTRRFTFICFHVMFFFSGWRCFYYARWKWKYMSTFGIVFAVFFVLFATLNLCLCTYTLPLYLAVSATPARCPCTGYWKIVCAHKYIERIFKWSKRQIPTNQKRPHETHDAKMQTDGGVRECKGRGQ